MTANDGPESYEADEPGHGVRVIEGTQHGFPTLQRRKIAAGNRDAVIQRGRFGFNAVKSSRMVGVR